jgi:hypothetical protein
MSKDADKLLHALEAFIEVKIEEALILKHPDDYSNSYSIRVSTQLPALRKMLLDLLRSDT